MVRRGVSYKFFISVLRLVSWDRTRLRKRTTAETQTDNSYSRQLEMPFPALISLAKVWNKDGNRTNAQSPPKFSQQPRQ
ncbi:hypothetical protein [Telluribacter sp.]|jgi:hypothetical protein|uniref:hypothetical protein n=1 Tax=Telluribacter sp. TaxID=1978767 RepID=UPI002E15C2B4|nr:hypothetical protein [Telluribacter sp.]